MNEDFLHADDMGSEEKAHEGITELKYNRDMDQSSYEEDEDSGTGIPRRVPRPVLTLKSQEETVPVAHGTNWTISDVKACQIKNNKKHQLNKEQKFCQVQKT